MPAFHPVWLDAIASVNGLRTVGGCIIWLVGTEAFCLPEIGNAAYSSAARQVSGATYSSRGKTSCQPDCQFMVRDVHRSRRIRMPLQVASPLCPKGTRLKLPCGVVLLGLVMPAFAQFSGP